MHGIIIGDVTIVVAGRGEERSGPTRYGGKVGRDRRARRALERFHPTRLKPVGPAIRPYPAAAVLIKSAFLRDFPPAE